MKIGRIVSQHVGCREQFHRTRDLSASDSPRGELGLALTVGHGTRDLRALVALGEGSSEIRHGWVGLYECGS